MSSCTRCGSQAINPHMHGRVEGLYLDLCDVCYWRNEVERLNRIIGIFDKQKAKNDI
jgi:hypothetical protein